MSRGYRGFSNWRFTLLGLLVAGLVAWAQWRGWLPREEGGGARRMEGWEELEGCSLAEGRGNDGDSFEVLHGGKRYVVRLYFVDCPEKARHQYNGERLQEQGRYFGGLTEGETVVLGEEARDFTLERLRAGRFALLTRWERVFDSERHYAFVKVGGGDLGELLVGEGLARIHTKGEDRPGGGNAGAEKQRLLGLERGARQAGKGGWGRR